MARKEVEESHNQTDMRYIRRHPKHDRFSVRRLGLAAPLIAVAMAYLTQELKKNPCTEGGRVSYTGLRSWEFVRFQTTRIQSSGVGASYLVNKRQFDNNSLPLSAPS
jgi:hypothetical protein